MRNAGTAGVQSKSLGASNAGRVCIGCEAVRGKSHTDTGISHKEATYTLQADVTGRLGTPGIIELTESLGVESEVRTAG